jgi:hypothetical protein
LLVPPRSSIRGRKAILASCQNTLSLTSATPRCGRRVVLVPVLFEIEPLGKGMCRTKKHIRTAATRATRLARIALVFPVSIIEGKLPSITAFAFRPPRPGLDRLRASASSRRCSGGAGDEGSGSQPRNLKPSLATTSSSRLRNWTGNLAVFPSDVSLSSFAIHALPDQSAAVLNDLVKPNQTAAYCSSAVRRSIASLYDAQQVKCLPYSIDCSHRILKFE